jgi:hypothetical protein
MPFPKVREMLVIPCTMCGNKSIRGSEQRHKKKFHVVLLPGQMQ